MEFNTNSSISAVCTPMVRNTFISLDFFPDNTQSRSKSVPPSSRLCRDEPDYMYDGKLVLANLDSDASTDAQESTCSESGLKTPLGSDDFDMSPPTPALVEHVFFPPSQPQRLNSKAAAFAPQMMCCAPQMVEDQAAKKKINTNFADTIKYARKYIRGSELVADIDISESSDGWSIIIRPTTAGDNDSESVIALAKEALLEAAANFRQRGIYLLGYVLPEPFNLRSQGFQATLAAMESPVTACWYYFKKGHCRHGDSCCKRHPVAEVPVQVLIETAKCSPCADFSMDFKHQVADIVTSVSARLGECHFTEKVEVLKNEASSLDDEERRWTISVTVQEESISQKEYLLNLAKNSLFKASNDSQNVYIMGYASNPFMTTSNGFITMLGDMQDEQNACWPLYSKGVCRRVCSCDWQHPECLMPINIVIKTRA